jgi:DNA ligase-1
VSGLENDGDTVEVWGSAAKPYVLRNVAGVLSCSCPAWRNQSLAIDGRTCKHLKKVRGIEAEVARVGAEAAAGPVRRKRKKKQGVSKEWAAKRVAETWPERKGGKVIQLPDRLKREPEAGETEPEAEPEKPSLLLAQKWTPEHDPSGWHMSEKLDGVRAYWDGKRFVSRLGNVYFAPPWFTEGLPDFPLDGELFVARGEFQRTVSIVRRHNGGDEWGEVSYLVFDAPSHGGLFEARLKEVRSAVKGVPNAKAVKHTRCKGQDHLERELAKVEKAGGEGLMLREPSSEYVGNRSATLLKVKTFHDAEAVVIGHTAGRGRHKGRCGALQVRRDDGTEFKVGTGMSDQQRNDPPPVGSVITYRYQELTKAGVPRFPSFVGVAVDKPGSKKRRRRRSS